MNLRKLTASVSAHAGVLACSMVASSVVGALIFAFVRPGIYSGLSFAEMMRWDGFRVDPEGLLYMALIAVVFFLPVHALYIFFRKSFKPLEVVAFSAALWGALTVAFIVFLYG